MNDLTEIALDALERAESADNQSDASDTTNDGADEKDTSNADDGDDNDAENDDDSETENTDDNDGDDSDDKSDDDDSDDNDESESDDKKKSDEMTDEEFEELAKKRGYSKKSDDDEKKKAEDDARRRADAINSIPKPKELDADTWSAMPPMNKVIYSRLPYITAHGKDGDVKIKTPEQLPDDFEFANDKARAQYTNDIQAQENMAQQMANYIQGQTRQQQASVQQREQARAIIAEVNELQKTGDLPTPKAQPNTPEFDTDPAVKIINNVLNYQAQRARQGVHLSVRDAYLLCRAEHPDVFKKPEIKAKGDDERKSVAKKVSGNNKSTNKSAAEESAGNKRKYYRPGMSTQDVLDRALQDLD